MQRSTIDSQEALWEAPSETLRVAGSESCNTDRGPTAAELFLEAGIVLAVALGASVVAQLFLGLG
jgi:hypothetical protein